MAAEIIREFNDAPVLIVSSFRTPEGNKAFRGAPDSIQLRGMVLDLRCSLKLSFINEYIIRRGFLYYSVRSVGRNGFDIIERYLQIDTLSIGYTPDEEFGS